MKEVTASEIKKIYLPPSDSHKGQNGRLLIIGGSHLFHAASLWALTVASRIVDLVHYSSIPENNELVLKIKSEFRDGIVVPRGEIDNYIEEDDCILIGPGMTRDNETKELTDRLLKKYPHKQWVIDAGALQMMNVNLIPKSAILTPHAGEFQRAFGTEVGMPFSAHPSNPNVSSPLTTSAKDMTVLEKAHLPVPSQIIESVARKHSCILLVKGQKDIACNGITGECREISGGNAGMTKGGTGDVLAGLIAALACKNDPWLSTLAGSFINKKAGDELYRKVGPFFNATDLANQIPLTMKKLFL